MRTLLPRNLIVSLLLIIPITWGTATRAQQSCGKPGDWYEQSKSTFQTVSSSDLLKSSEGADFILLGERHDRYSDHLWQAHTLSLLLGKHDRLSIGLEMLPRSAQAAIDQWLKGEIDTSEFLLASGWYEHWRFDADLYQPIFNLAKLNNLKVFALNVDGNMITQVSKAGWDSLGSEEKQIVGKPSPAPAEYEAYLREIWLEHAATDEEGFQNFVEAQLTWDRAFAEALVSAKKNTDGLVVGLIGAGHLNTQAGVAHQLQDLGNFSIRTWIPISEEGLCEILENYDRENNQLGDAIFVTPSRQDLSLKEKVGLYLRDADQGVIAENVLENSLASNAGLIDKDLIIKAAGAPVKSAAELIAIINRQSAGFWLPLTIIRQGVTTELIIKFEPIL